VVADLATFVPSIETYDAVAFVFVHLPAALRSAIHHSCIHALKPGGLLLIEAFTPQQLQYTSGGPKDADLLYSAEILRQDCSTLDILLLEEAVVTLREGPFHDGEAAVVRLVARRRYSE